MCPGQTTKQGGGDRTQGRYVFMISEGKFGQANLRFHFIWPPRKLVAEGHTDMSGRASCWSCRLYEASCLCHHVHAPNMAGTATKDGGPQKEKEKIDLRAEWDMGLSITMFERTAFGVSKARASHTSKKIQLFMMSQPLALPCACSVCVVLV